MFEKFDVAVIGAGHAGVEAALASARLGMKTVLFTIYMDNIAMMSCNPAIGGPGKSHLISEVDILGGEIGRHTDMYNIQLKHLNESRGIAARVTRGQADKYWYRVKMKEIVENTPNLTVMQEHIDEIKCEGKKVVGVISAMGNYYETDAVVVATGTFLKGRIVMGNIKYPAGRQGEVSSEKLSDNLISLGIEIERYQTATPPRVNKRTIDFSKVTEMKGEDNPRYFSIFTNKNKNQNLPTWLTYTSDKTVETVQKLIKYSPIYTGIIETKGPRHCPSIDRKVVNFPDKKDHQVFLEQESIESNEIYVNGMTTAMPPFAQDEILKTLPGLENVKIMRYAYGIEYDYAPAYQLNPTLESKKIAGLYFAGQINGTSGYEEAAAQGFMAGVNAAKKIKGEKPFIIDRSEGYIGVMIDDIINKTMLEPYRVLPSRAEYRLTLRQDNTFMRLLNKSEEAGIMSPEKIKIMKEMKEAVETETERLKTTFVYPDIETNLMLEGMEEEKLKKAVRAADLLNRDKFSYRDLKPFSGIRSYPEIVIEQVEINIKYENFIEREREQIERFKELESKKIPAEINYDEIKGVSNIAREAFKKVKPESIGQASRISGVAGNDISMLIMHLKKE